MGGRGSKSGSGGILAFSNGKWSNGLGFVNHDTLKDALGSKGKQKSMADSMLGSNPKYSRDYREYSSNCQRVVVAYEARRRGYDVTAQATYQGDKLNKVAYIDEKEGIPRGRWMGAFQNAKPVNVSATGRNSEKKCYEQYK